MNTDPYQMSNLYNSFSERTNLISSYVLDNLQHRLDASLLVLKSCKGQDECMTPWKVLHPQGDVQSLDEAMNPKFDDFYRNQPKIGYPQCSNGYLPAFEGPQQCFSA